MGTRGKVGGDRYRVGTAGIKIQVIRVWRSIVAAGSSTQSARHLPFVRCGGSFLPEGYIRAAV